MQKDRFYRHVFIAFALVLVVYVGVFSCDQRVRQRKGPWQVTFFTTNDVPAIRVSQPFLNITNVQITFAGETITNEVELPTEFIFARPGQPLPFGTVKFEDLTYLPGSVTLHLFGHEVELLPRTLYLNKKEVPWASGASHTLEAQDKLPPEILNPPPKKKRRAPATQAGTNSPRAPIETR